MRSVNVSIKVLVEERPKIRESSGKFCVRFAMGAVTHEFTP